MRAKVLVVASGLMLANDLGRHWPGHKIIHILMRKRVL
jgi:hypothetical protein